MEITYYSLTDKIDPTEIDIIYDSSVDKMDTTEIKIIYDSSMDKMDTTEIKIIYDSSMDKIETTEIQINSDHVQTIQEDKMFELDEKEKSLPCIETSQQDNDSKPDENYTICENDEDTMSCNDFMELRRRCVQLDLMIM